MVAFIVVVEAFTPLLYLLMFLLILRLLSLLLFSCFLVYYDVTVYIFVTVIGVSFLFIILLLFSVAVADANFGTVPYDDVVPVVLNVIFAVVVSAA